MPDCFDIFRYAAYMRNIRKYYEQKDRKVTIIFKGNPPDYKNIKMTPQSVDRVMAVHSLIEGTYKEETGNDQEARGLTMQRVMHIVLRNL